MTEDDVLAAIALVRSQMRRVRNDIIQLQRIGIDIGPSQSSLDRLQGKLDLLLDERDALAGDARRKYPRNRKRPAANRRPNKAK
ncbi:hypothetical protein [Tardiphaga sp. 709]|uniref:hypothetical protein n=1 Tax=Tardiphaga sp. 709 TaxID=3076039 RepID=UPI0028E950D7|nr:hypothetical protein [Tardiphaga sp. 709]WNV12826.1 hypothetical protein RSO67_30120 [Tardiphaga sp. 709]